MTTPYNAGSDYDLDSETLERVLELTDGENPVPFINMDEPTTAEALIAGIDSRERLEGWRLANQSFFAPPKRLVTEALEKRERELAGDEIDTPTADTTPEPVPATDGGERIDGSRSSSAVSADGGTPVEPEATADPDDVHPDTRGLEAGDVVVREREESTEYVFPTTPAADEPYHLLEITAEGDERTSMPIGTDSAQSRLLADAAETVRADSLEIDVPTTAATNGVER